MHPSIGYCCSLCLESEPYCVAATAVAVQFFVRTTTNSQAHTEDASEEFVLPALCRPHFLLFLQAWFSARGVKLLFLYKFCLSRNPRTFIPSYSNIFLDYFVQINCASRYLICWGFGVGYYATCGSVLCQIFDGLILPFRRTWRIINGEADKQNYVENAVVRNCLLGITTPTDTSQPQYKENPLRSLLWNRLGTTTLNHDPAW